MHVLMTKEQFDEAKKKAGSAKMKLKEDDDTHGTIESDDFIMGYFYNSAESRLFLGPCSKRKTLAAYCAGDNIIATYIMDSLAAVPSSKGNGKDKNEEKHEGESGEAGEKKDQNQHQSQPSQ